MSSEVCCCTAPAIPTPCGFRVVLLPLQPCGKMRMSKTYSIRKATTMKRLQADSNEINAVASREDGSDGGGWVKMVGDGKRLALVRLLMARDVRDAWRRPTRERKMVEVKYLGTWKVRYIVDSWKMASWKMRKTLRRRPWFSNRFSNRFSDRFSDRFSA